ncbi:squamosa promoter-binding-like protein 6 isoform X2 [Nicotiana sylvestris]|uniref:Squamosa promoter-binding-like protein 6 isoform X2 n=1 Tax=Nicotiana sylvestris TaxID=4096 RepID=A0A1U7WJ90_NICSY|nr:PREDICTED: squamosa promoter-binding-like protein 6 isoform X2 [Nicotiana sylvestris]
MYCRKKTSQFLKQKMESWSFFSVGKGFVSEDSVSLDDRIIREKHCVTSWELNNPSSFGSTVGIENQEFPKLGTPNNQIRDVLSNKISGGGVFSSVTVPQIVFSGASESSSKMSRSVVESNCRDSSLVDLKLGSFPGQQHVQSFKSPKIMTNLSSNVPDKRMRSGGLKYQTPYCQVQGCSKDLSSSKDYNKRHKVCEVHSKTAKVIVNGIEQRFCQQCSRFHLLAEFDDGKRSCRKRLAGHNERRRKPQTGRFQGTSFAMSSSLCQNILGSSILYQPKYEMEDWYKNVKVEDAADYNPRLTMPFTNGHSQSKSLCTSYHAEKQCPPFHDEEITAPTRSKIDESSKSYLHDIEGSDFVTRPLVQSFSIGGDVLHVLDSISTIQGISGISNSGCAPSLLSSQSQDSSNQSSLIPTASHLITPSSNAHYNVTHISEKPLGVSPQALSSRVPDTFNSAGVNSGESCLEQILVSNSSNNCFINDPMIDLLQLSSQIQ